MDKASIEELQEYITLLEDEIKELKMKQEEDKNTYTALEQEYENIIEGLNRDLANANGKIISQNITLESYKSKVGTPIIVEGSEQDLYKGEQKDFIIHLIRTAMSNSSKHTRSYKICESLLGSNMETGRRTEIKDGVSSILKSYTGSNGDIIPKFAALDIKVVADKNHFKLMLAGDDRYVVSLSHTSSDVKCGLNAISDINRIFF